MKERDSVCQKKMNGCRRTKHCDDMNIQNESYPRNSCSDVCAYVSETLYDVYTVIHRFSIPATYDNRHQNLN